MISLRIVLAAMLLSVASACSPFDQARSLRRPETLTDLLLNMQAVAVSGVLADRSFYTQPTLTRVFGGTSATISFSEVPGFAHVLQEAVIERVPNGRVRLMPGADMRSGYMVLTVEGSTFTVGDAEKVFGSGWQRVTPYISAHGQQPFEDRILYCIGAAHEQRMIFSFTRSAVLEQVEVNYNVDRQQCGPA